MLTFSATLPEKVTGVPSQRDCACVLGIPQSTLVKREKALIKKLQQLSTGKAGIFWVLAKCKKVYSKINEAIRSFLVEAFNNHPHVIMSPNARDMLQVKNLDGEKVAVPKLLMQGGLRPIFSDIIKDNPTIKNKVGEHAFCYIIIGLGSIHCFTNSYKQMCSCTECVGLHTLHHLLHAKHGVMHRQFAVDVQHCTRAAQVAEKASGWSAVAWHPKAIYGHHGGHLRAMEFACCAALGVSDAPVWQLQGVPHSKGGGTRGQSCRGHILPRVQVQGQSMQGWQGAQAAGACAEAHKDQQVPLPVLLACPRPWVVPFHQLHAGSALLEGEADDHAR
jgi:hypothetical protein